MLCKDNLKYKINIKTNQYKRSKTFWENNQLIVGANQKAMESIHKFSHPQKNNQNPLRNPVKKVREFKER